MGVGVYEWSFLLLEYSVEYLIEYSSLDKVSKSIYIRRQHFKCTFCTLGIFPQTGKTRSHTGSK